MNRLLQSVSYLSGVGPKTKEGLAELGIITINDLLHYFPFRYEDLIPKSVNEAADQEKIVIKGIVANSPVIRRFGYKKTILIDPVIVDNESIRVTFFNQPWLKDKFEVGKEIAIYGRWNEAKRALTGIKILAAGDLSDNSVDSVYPTNKKIHQKTLVKLIKEAVAGYLNYVVDPIAPELQEKYDLLPEKQIIQKMHFPKDINEAKAARRSAKFRELYLYMAKLEQLKQKEVAKTRGLSENYDESYVQKFVDAFPFKFTDAQVKVVREILNDMKSQHHMNRLLQGDVGSGKTAVAATAIFAAVTAGFQTALMVPTEILAEQHYLKLKPLFAKFHITTTLLTGSLTAAEHKKRVKEIKAGRINVIIGTQALYQKDIEYKNLGLVIIDEQHRFGVKQRQALREKGHDPDVLVMTATPIPRTLAITEYGEMSLSIIDQLPAGRKNVETFWLRFNKIDQVYYFLSKQLSEKAQVFVVVPLISESEKIDLNNAESVYERMSQTFKNASVALLHGQMTQEEKDRVMVQFKNKQIDILIATTVIEVGVDVPNASVMLIYNADRFGLSQLHQLRGRVGRGIKQSYCVLLADPKNDTAIQRMKVMTQTNDGFKLAQKDLELRGSGDFFGNKQTGMPEFKVADPVGDEVMLEYAHKEVQDLFTKDPELKHESGLRQYLSIDKQYNFD